MRGRAGARSPVVGRYNRGLVLEAVRLRPGLSRVEVAAATGLTAAAVSNIVRGLIHDGLVEEAGSGGSIGGKPRVRLLVRPHHQYAVGLHLRPATVGVAVTDLDGTVVRHSIERLRRGRTDPQSVLEVAAAAAERLLRECAVARGSVLGVGVACPGPIDVVRRLIVNAPNLPGWVDVPVAEVLEDALRLPVTLENNANAAAIGEKWVGAARDVPTFLYVYLGIGVGGAIFIDHEIYRGASGNAAAIGHVVVDPDGPRCRCGNRGCLEVVCSVRAIARRVRALVPKVREELGLRLTRLSLDADHEKILRAAQAGHAAVRRAVVPALEELAAAVAGLVNVLDVGHVVLGGPAILGAPALYLEPIEAALASRPIARRVQSVRVSQSSLGAVAAVVGAASLIFHDTYAPSLSTRRPLRRVVSR